MKRGLYGTISSLLITLLLLTPKISLAEEQKSLREDNPSKERCFVEDKSQLLPPPTCELEKTAENCSVVFKCPPAKGWRFSVKGIGGIMHYKYKDRLMGKVKGYPLFVVGAGTRILFPGHQWSFNGHAQTTTTLKTNNSETIPLSQKSGSTSLFTRAQNQESERYDYSVSFGYDDSVSFGTERKKIGLFLGYRWTDTTVHGRALTFPGTIVPTDPVWVSTFPLVTQAHLKTHGAFIGLKLVPVEGHWGAVGINAFWVPKPFNYGEYRYTSTYITSVQKIPDLSTDAKSSAYNVGVDFERPLFPARHYVAFRLHASLNYYHYKMDTLKAVFPDGGSFGDFSVKESIVTANLGLILQFQF